MTLRLVLWASLALATIFVVQEWRVDEPLFPDSWGFWTFGRYVLSHAPATIYDDAALHAFQTRLGIPDENGFYPYPYPPWFLLAVAPLGVMPYPMAALAWRIGTFAALVVAVGAWRWRWDRALLLVVAPACALSFVVGQNGFLTAALMLGGLRLLPGRPLLAGMLLGTLAYKPQMAVLVPFFLAFGGHWRAMAGVGIAVAGLTAATVLAFGIAIWPAWLDTMLAQAMALSAGRAPKLDQMPTITAAVQVLGGSAGLARVVQGVAAILALAALSQGRRASHPAVLPLATFLATPYAFGYDLPVVAAAALLTLPDVPGRLQALLLACVLAPCVMAVPGGAVVLPGLFAATLWVIIRR